jgi:aminopeptidase N
MTRTVDEILREAGVTVETLRADAERYADYHFLRIDVAAEEIAELYTTDPAERAALVQHMIERRG